MSVLKTKELENNFDTSRSLVVDRIRRLFHGQCRRILLINPPQFPEEQLNIRIAKNKRYYNYPPYGLGLLSHNLKKRGYNVHILDLNYELLAFIHKEEDEETILSNINDIWQTQVSKIIADFQPDLVGFSCMFTMSHEITIKIADWIKSQHADLPIVAGGVHVTNAPDIVLKEGKSIDFVSLYEGDNSFCDFLDFINSDTVHDELTQLGTLIDDRYVFIKERNIPNPEVMNVVPDYLDLDIGRYDSLGEIGTFRYWRPENSRGSISLSNKGCRGHCSFCSVRNFNGAGVRSRSVWSIVDEIEILVCKYNVNHITWLDDDLFYNPKRTIKLFEEITKRNLNITWDASNGVIISSAVASPELIHGAAESGCIGMYFGIESGNPGILREIRKPSSVKQCLKLGEIMKKYPQIFTRGFLIIGFPNETYGQMLDTVEVAQAMGLDWYTVQLLTPLPSTEIYSQMVEEGLIKDGTLNVCEDGFTMFSVRESERQRLQELKEKTNTRNFNNYLKRNVNIIPTKQELDDVWFLIDYKVNYEKILTEEEPVRLSKMRCFLNDISGRMSINNPLSTLYLGVVEKKLGNLQGAQDAALLSKKYLKGSVYWENRFDMLDLEPTYESLL